MSKKSGKNVPNCKRKLDQSDENKLIPAKGRKEDVNTAIKISSQIGGAQQPSKRSNSNKATRDKQKPNKGTAESSKSPGVARRTRNLWGTKDIASSVNEVDAREAGTSVMTNPTIGLSSGGNNNASLLNLSDEQPVKTHRKVTKSSTVGRLPIEGAMGLDMYDGIQVNVNPMEDDFGTTDDEEIADDNDSEFSEVVLLPSKKCAPPTNDEIAEEVQQWKSNPAVKQFFWEMFADEFKEREDALIQTVADKVSKASQEKQQTQQPSRGNAPGATNRPRLETVKSPSDTTIYRPAYKVQDDSDKIINKISNFVEGIRIESSIGGSKQKDPHHVLRTPLAAKLDNSQHHHAVEARGEEPQPNAKLIGEELTQGADKYKAKLPPPTGELTTGQLSNLLRSLDDDDEFFHITCHIDKTLKQKIECGEYIYLEQLLPRDKGGSGGYMETTNEDSRVELVSHGGHTYFKPVKESQIHGLHKWEQAFRVYVAIYTNVNPE